MQEKNIPVIVTIIIIITIVMRKKNEEVDYVRVAKNIKSNHKTLLKTAEEAHRPAECLLRSR